MSWAFFLLTILMLGTILTKGKIIFKLMGLGVTGVMSGIDVAFHGLPNPDLFVAMGITLVILAWLLYGVGWNRASEFLTGVSAQAVVTSTVFLFDERALDPVIQIGLGLLWIAILVWVAVWKKEAPVVGIKKEL